MNADKTVLVLSAFIGVHRRLKSLSSAPGLSLDRSSSRQSFGKSGSFPFLAASPHTRARSGCQSLVSGLLISWNRDELTNSYRGRSESLNPCQLFLSSRSAPLRKIFFFRPDRFKGRNILGFSQRREDRKERNTWQGIEAAPTYRIGSIGDIPPSDLRQHVANKKILCPWRS